MILLLTGIDIHRVAVSHGMETANPCGATKLALVLSKVCVFLFLFFFLVFRCPLCYTVYSFGVIGLFVQDYFSLVHSVLITIFSKVALNKRYWMRKKYPYEQFKNKYSYSTDIIVKWCHNEWCREKQWTKAFQVFKRNHGRLELTVISHLYKALLYTLTGEMQDLIWFITVF